MTVPLTDDERLQRELTPKPFRLWVEGDVTVMSWNEEAREHADRLTHAALSLGLQPFRQEVSGSEDLNPPAKRHRWTHRRVSSDDLLAHVRSRPGIHIEALLEAAYYETPWTELKAARAKAKLETALHRLERAGVVIKRYGEDGRRRWQLPGVDAGLLSSASGPTLAHHVDHGRRRVLNDEQLSAGSDVLKRLNVFKPTDLAADPHLYRDLVRAVFAAVENAPGGTGEVL